MGNLSRHAVSDLAKPAALAGLCLAIAWDNQAMAFNIDSGNEDLSMSLDTTVRYNQGWRTSSRDKTLASANGGAFDEGNYLSDKGDVMLSRLDLFTEFDLNWQQRFGLRTSAAAWYDHNFPDESQSAPGLESSANYRNNNYNGYVKRYYAGPSAEFRDYFVWGNFAIGSTDLNLKAGSFAWLPGEFLLGNGGSISYSMAPNDGLLSDLSPGASAKETALPIGQVAATWQVIPELSFMLQYTYDYKVSRISEGGTYYAVNDGGIQGPDFMTSGFTREDSKEGDNGDVSLGVKWSPDWAQDSSFGLWYRKFDDKNASWANQLVINGTNRYARAVYAKDIELYGLTWNGLYQSIGLGAEINYRKNMPLNSANGAGFYLGANGVEPDIEGARGDTVHALVSGAFTINKNPLFDSGSVAVQLDYMHLVDVTSNKQYFLGSNGVGGSGTLGNRCENDALLENCSTKNAASIGVNFTPVWQQVLPSIDLSFPMFVTYGLYGNAAAANAGITPEDSYLLKVGPRMEYFYDRSKHQFDLAYTHRDGRRGFVDRTNTQGYSALAYLHDRDTVILTYQTSF